MKKNIIFFFSTLILSLLISCNTESPALEEEPYAPKSFLDISAEELTAKIKIGWNLGNTLDAPNETEWGNPYTRKSNIDAIKAAGFNAVRIPISWNHHVDSSYNINAGFMKRVKEIAGYAIDNDMYIIINTHHDENIFKFQNADMTASKLAFEKVWKQIAGQLRNENEKLIFEGLNEPRTKGSQREWQGGTAEEWANLNQMEQIFVNVVRASGSNNTKRILMITTYAASAEQAAMDGLILPDDPSNSVNKFIVSIHAYSPYNFALNEGAGAVNTWSAGNFNDTNGVNTPLDRAYNKFVSNRIPVIMGEFGALNRNNESARAAWAEYYVSYAKSKNIPCFWWDDGGNFKLLNRGNNTFYFPAIKDALIRGAN
jgi:endoglucanase